MEKRFSEYDQMIKLSSQTKPIRMKSLFGATLGNNMAFNPHEGQAEVSEFD